MLRKTLTLTIAARERSYGLDERDEESRHLRGNGSADHGNRSDGNAPGTTGTFASFEDIKWETMVESLPSER